MGLCPGDLAASEWQSSIQGGGPSDSSSWKATSMVRRPLSPVREFYASDPFQQHDGNIIDLQQTKSLSAMNVRSSHDRN